MPFADCIVKRKDGQNATSCYNRILYVEIVCKSCGTWRGAIREEAEFYPCPRCTSNCTLSLAVEGFSRQDLPEWQLIVKALSERAGQTIMVDDFSRTEEKSFEIKESA